MTLDPAFGLLLAMPIALLAIAAAFLVRPSRKVAPVIVACGVLGFVAGCSGPAKTSDTQTTTTMAVTPLPAPPLSEAQRGAAQRAKPGGGVSVDVFDARPDGAANVGGVTVAASATLNVLGWAFDESKHATCGAVGLVVDGKNVFPASYGSARTDVAAFYKDPARTNVGYIIKVPARDLGAGAHATRVACIGADGASGTSGVVRNVTVR